MKIENLSSEEVKREQFRSLLLNLANPNIKLSDKSQRVIYYKELEEIYHQNGENDFRHFYSDIFAVLTSIYEDPTRGDINILGENIGILRKEYQAINTDQNNQLIDISSSLMKLYDHVSLDIARISYSVAGNRDILSQDSLEKIRTQINIQEAELKKIKNNTNKAEEKINNAQKEYIAILGIFSALVLAFTGGMTFSTSVLENMHSVSIYRILMVILLVGFVLINVMYLLFEFILNIIGKNSKKLSKPYLAFVDLIILILMLAVYMGWSGGYVEKRNQVITVHSITHSTNTNYRI